MAERAIEFNVPVYCALVDYTEASDARNRTTLGRVLPLFLPHTMARRVLSLYFDAKAKVVAGENSKGPLFDLLRGVRQGGVTQLFHCSVGVRKLVDSNHVRGYEASPPPFMHTRVC